MYHGRADVFQENLETFLSIAEEFQLKGLTSDLTETIPDQTQSTKEFHSTVKHQETFDISIDNQNKSLNNLPGTVALMDSYESINKVHINNDLKELDEQIESMIEKLKNKWTCKMCGKIAAQGKADIKKHVEGKHIEGIYHPCKHCDKTFRSRQIVEKHLYKFHKF